MELVELNSSSQPQQHRERAVDVPESFVACVKQAPRYPPPQSHHRFISQLDSGKQIIKPNFASNHSNRFNINNNKVSFEHDKLRKYSAEFHKKRTEEDFLRSSLRGSKKLQQLKTSSINNNVLSNNLNGCVNAIVNDAFEADESVSVQSDLPNLKYVLQKLTKQLNDSYFESLVKNCNLENLFDIYRTIIEHQQKNQHQKNKFITDFLDFSSVDLIQNIILLLQVESSISSEAAELLNILTKFELEGLCTAFDKVAQTQKIYNDFENHNHFKTSNEENDEGMIYNERIDDSIRIVCLKKSNCEPLGITIKSEPDGSVVIGRIVKGGAGEKCGLLKEGDEIIEINGIEMQGRNVNQICDMLSELNGTLSFVLATRETSGIESLRSTQTMVHLRALFDYDPEEDIYIPCRELGICFNKGDIIHVIDQTDLNWWQAFKQGEHEQRLAGLVPSIHFQIQRDSMKQSLMNDSNHDGGKYKSKASLLCGGRKNKKKNKLSCGLSDEVLTYEEVHLYYPKANMKRPIVLIGPTNIGRHELRQRIMLDTERFAAAVPHTSRSRRDGEMDGVDYHFISRSEFELHIKQGKFVEHGQYEGNYYGTSLGAIEAVVQSGKVCLLNLHVHSIHVLRQGPAGAKLKPYFVFVAPPTQLDRLNKLIATTTNHSIENCSISTNDLQAIIEEAKEIELKYGHYFDMVLSITDIDRAYHELLKDINALEREPQWIPKIWFK